MNSEYNSAGTFWEWFKSISKDLAANLNDERILSELDKKVASLGPFDWEVGPRENLRAYFAISPALNRELWLKTKEIIGKAPECEGWDFLSAKPEKGWTGFWRMSNEYGNTIGIDADPWKYKLYKFDDNTFDIDILIEENLEGGEDIYYWAADIAITNLLGEDKYMRLISNLTIVRKSSFKDLGKWSLLKFLAEHLESLRIG